MFIAIWIGFAVVTALAAQARGRSFLAWLLIGALTGVFGLLAALVMARIDTAESPTPAASGSPAAGGTIRVHKGRHIRRAGEGFDVDGHWFADYSDAMAFIDRNT